MIKPIISNISPFDATKDCIVKFTYNYSQIFGRHVVIKNNATNEIVDDYTTTATTADRMKQEHTITAGTLTNGVTYNIVVSVFDSKGNESPVSNTIVFSCYSHPIFKFTNIKANDVIGSQTFTFKLSYSQTQSLVLDNFTVELYDYSKTNLIYSTGTIYDNNLNILIGGLSDNSSYYIRATGETINGMLVDTGYVYFTVDYVSPEIFSLLTLENVSEEASIKLTSNFVLIEGRQSGIGDLTYKDSRVILTNEQKVTFDEGVNLNPPYSISGRFMNANCPAELMTLSDGRDKIVISWLYGDFGNGKENYIELIMNKKISPTKSYKYIGRSNRLGNLSNTDLIELLIQKIDGNYNLAITKIV